MDGDRAGMMTKQEGEAEEHCFSPYEAMGWISRKILAWIRWLVQHALGTTRGVPMECVEVQRSLKDNADEHPE
jgi:hypothetical protein